jgi:diketogulonate reductase-like aldo/keto reductase
MGILLFSGNCARTSPYLSLRQGDAPFPKSEDGTLLYDDIDYKLTWAAMEKLVGKGMIRAIGLSNFNSRQIDDVLSVANIKPTVLQVRRRCVDCAYIVPSYQDFHYT